VLRIFSANHIYQFLFVPVIGCLLVLHSFLHPGVFPPENAIMTTPFYVIFNHLQISYTTALVINLVVVFSICLLLQEINTRYSFVKARTFLPSYLFLFFVFTMPSMHIVQPVFFAVLFVLLAIRRIFASFEKKKAFSNAFDAAFLTTVASVFYLPALLLIILVPWGMFIVRGQISWREFAASFLGLLLPWGYTFAVYFIWFDVAELLHLFANAIIFPADKFVLNPFILSFIGVVAIITISASVFMLRQYDENKISTRRYFKVLFFYFIISLLLFALPLTSYEVLGLAALPLTYLVTNYFLFMKRRVWAEIFFQTVGVIAFVFQLFM
jgi:hypothetical protein